jgi:hypothetical protein
MLAVVESGAPQRFVVLFDDSAETARGVITDVGLSRSTSFIINESQRVVSVAKAIYECGTLGCTTRVDAINATIQVIGDDIKKTISLRPGTVRFIATTPVISGFVMHGIYNSCVEKNSAIYRDFVNNTSDSNALRVIYGRLVNGSYGKMTNLSNYGRMMWLIYKALEFPGTAPTMGASDQEKTKSVCRDILFQSGVIA